MPITPRQLKNFESKPRHQIEDEISKLTKVAEKAAAYASLAEHPAWKDLWEELLNKYLHVETLIGTEPRGLPALQAQIKLVAEIKNRTESKIKEAQDVMKKIDELRRML